jgi:putative endonuclease
MLSARVTQAIVRTLDWLAKHTLQPEEIAEHLKTGRKGEEEAYFYLRQRGYIMVARNFRSPRRHGDLDLVGWEGDVLCFIEVKTRTTREVKPAQAAVDRFKQRELAGMAREYLRHMRETCQWRFDVISVYHDSPASQPVFELFRNAFRVS